MMSLLSCLPGEQQQGVPGHLGVVEDEASDPGEAFSPSRLQGHSSQGVRAQVQELQVGDVRHDFTDLRNER